VALYTLLGIYAAVLGLIVGSYLNVVVYRLPRGLSTVLPRSRCPGCGTAIRARDNFPVVSFLLLGGRCRECRAKISWRYPLTEAATGLLFLACFLRFGVSWQTPAAALFASLMLALAAIDAEHYILPDKITWPGIAAGILIQPLVPWARLRLWEVPDPWGAIAGGAWGALLGAGILLAIWAGWYLLRREEGMGLGDVKMLALIGAFLGWKGMLVAFFLSVLSGSVVGLAAMRWGRMDMKSKLPFGVFLALGGLLALFAGQPLADWYGGLLASSSGVPGAP
jgi:leader peptidase (prepilin peptidase)/N-methyltransferase